MLQKMETGLERGLFSARWLMAPFYVGLMAALGILLIAFAQKLWAFALSAFSLSAPEAIMGVLGLIDLTLVAGLLIIVVFSGYENFVSKIDVGKHEDLPDWKGKVDFNQLKLKLIASIVAISGIHLLKIFMDIKKYSDQDIYWMVVIHVVFVGSAVLLALMDYIVKKARA